VNADRPTPLRTISTGWRRDKRGYNHFLSHFLALLREPGFRKSVDKARASLGRAQAARAAAEEEARGGFRSNTKRAGSELSDGPPKKRYRHHEETTDDDDDDQPDVEAVEEEEEPAPSQQITAADHPVAAVAAGHDE
jgi:hypothetical protein